jgi:hypothetical protein
MVILFDDSHISGNQYKTSRDSAEKFVNANMRPQDLLAVVSHSVSLRVLQVFTHDRDKILEAIRRPVGPAATPDWL